MQKSAAMLYTDLAGEMDFTGCDGISEKHETVNGYTVSEIDIQTVSAAKRLHKPVGRYVTVDTGKLWEKSDRAFAEAVRVTAGQLRQMAVFLCGGMPEKILTVGLGNRAITADALGDLAVRKMTVTRHLKNQRLLYQSLGGRELSAIIPGVLGQTGIETAELVKGACQAAKPELIVAIDSLCARASERLGTTVQLGSSGIAPGSGLGSHREAIDRSSVGVPVIAFGIPTAIDEASLIADTLEKAGIHEFPDSLLPFLNDAKNFIVTPKETDLIVREMSRLTAEAVMQAFLS